MSPRTYSLCTTAIFACGLSVVAIFNWLVDPFGQYETGLLKPLIQDSRSVKLGLFDACEAAPDGLVLGSSRVLKLEPEYLQAKTGCSFFNAGVNHGRPTDYLAWIRCYEQRWHRLPAIVVLGLDTAAMTATVPIDGRITGEPRLAKLVPDRISWKENAQRFSELLSFKQFKASAKSLAYSLLKKAAPEPVEYFAPDGCIVYERREAELRDGKYDFAAALNYNDAEFRDVYRKFDRLVVEEITTLVDTVKLLRDNGTKVYLFNTPFHPELRRSLAKLPHFDEREREAKELVGILGSRFDIKIADLSDVHSFDGDANQFVDGIHPLEANTRRMIDCLFETPGKDRYAVQ